MDEIIKANLEANGFQIIYKYDDHFKTDTFIQTPDGRLVAHYDHLWQIPQNLNEGDEVSTPVTEVTPPARNTNSHELHAQWLYNEYGDWIGPIGIILVLMFIGIIVGVLFMKAFFANDRNPPPCGVRGSVIDITECIKEIIYPDCSGVLYDSCKGEIIDEFEPPKEIWGWLQWTVIGAVAIGSIFIIYKLVSMAERKRYLAAYEKYPERMAPPPPPRPSLVGRMAESAYGAGRDIYGGVRRRL